IDAFIKQRNRITDSFIYSDFNKRGLHSHLDHVPALTINATDSGAQAMRVTRQNHTEPRRGKSGITSRAIAVANFDETRRDAHRAVIKGKPRSNRIEISLRFIQERRGGSVERDPSAAEQLFESLRM